MPDFMLLSADTMNIPHQRARLSLPSKQLTAPVETCKLVPMTHYVVTVTSRLAKNI